MKNRGIKRLGLATLVVLLTIFTIRSYHWYVVGNGSYPISTEIEGPTLPYSEAMKRASSYQSDKDYYDKYFVEITYRRGNFPTIIEKIDTIKTELWHKNKRN